MQNMLLVVHLLICVVLVGAVLMQRSEGGALGMGGGGGGLISGRGAADMMVTITSWVAGLFFCTSILLTVLAGGSPVDRSVTDTPERPGIQFNIPFLNQKSPDAAPKTTGAISAPDPALAAPAATLVDENAPVAPPPVEAVTRAGPLAETPPVGAAKAAPASAGSGAASSTGGAVVAGPIGAAPASGGPSAATPPVRPAQGAQKVAPVPLAPLTPSPLPGAASSGESPQPADPGSSRDRNGPDE